MTDAEITVHRDATIGHVDPELHGHFSEHLGRCIYDGMWHADEADGTSYREDVVSLLADLDIPVLRWPGGCFADDYHWEDGVGPREERPRRRNLSWAQGPEQVPEESNAFGTHEFLDLCERIDAEPYLAVNVGSGDPQEAADWVEYCNYDGETDLAERRRANGREEPYEVRYWGIGNENWGCGGNMTPEQYAGEYRRFETYVGRTTRHLVDHDIERIVCGYREPEWTRRLLEAFASGPRGPHFPFDHLTFHRYYGRTISVPEADDADYDQVLAEALATGDRVERIAATVDATATTRDVGVIVDEWGAWHPEATSDSGLEQPGTPLDALSAAVVLNLFNHHADVVTMGNIAQTVNVLQCLVETDGEDAWARPTYRVFDLFTPHRDNDAVTTTVETPTRDLAQAGDSDRDDLPLVGASASVGTSASVGSDGGETFVTVTNRDCRAARTVNLALDGVDPAAATVDAEVLFADRAPDEVVTAANADSFAADPLPVETDSGVVTVELPPATVAAVSVR